MKKSITKIANLNVIALAAAVLLSACQQSTTKQSQVTSDSTTVQNQTACFNLISGNQNKDTLAISLSINGNIVVGTMVNNPFEKDIRKGSLTGKINNGNIKGTWKYMQEGREDSLLVEFKLEKNRLLQRPLQYNQQTGKEETNRSGNWIIIPGVACKDSETSTLPFAAEGTVKATVPGKDGYMATLTGEDGKTYIITMSRLHLEKNYTQLKVGDRLKVTGDTVHLNDQVNILVKEYKMRK